MANLTDLPGAGSAVEASDMGDASGRARASSLESPRPLQSRRRFDAALFAGWKVHRLPRTAAPGI